MAVKLLRWQRQQMGIDEFDVDYVEWLEVADMQLRGQKRQLGRTNETFAQLAVRQHLILLMNT